MDGRAKVTDTKGVLATGGLIGAVLASTCCIAPLALVTLGIGGAWVGNLTALAPYQWLFVLASIGFLGAGFWQVYLRPKAACDADGYCASRASDRIVKGALWIGTVLVIAALSVNLLTPLLV